MTSANSLPLITLDPQSGPNSGESSQKPGFLHLSDIELASFFEAAGEKPNLRKKQIREWLNRGVTDWAKMTDLPAKLREMLAQTWEVFSTRVALQSKSVDGTEKLLLEFADGGQIETVLMREEDRRTLCLSTQVGCGMGCVFCASGLEGLKRNLQTPEIEEEILRVRALLGPQERLSHIVVMGMGEPLANLERLLPALDWVCSPKGLGISARHVTISTVGLPKKIVELGHHPKPYHLAVSLHAPNDQIRERIVPTNKGVGIKAILEAAHTYQEISGRQVTYEYILLAGLNDHPTHAEELGRILTGKKSHVNLIPFNRVEGLPFQGPTLEGVDRFREKLRQWGVSATVRKRKGADIDAACGQLRREAARLAKGQGAKPPEKGP